ncbi:hypothetical protein QBC44DRAFT_367937 [Cladorrhinum sp. PSN332]|nr:hypothetical protein QBC44DRAFT_367937 [Cladorrhinum sp. PSN332]
MPTAVMSVNPFNPLCAVSDCLRQVVGYIDGNPEDQYAACISTFGVPVIATVTPTADVVLSTATTTVSYMDIVVSLTTQTSTLQDTVTSYETAFETATEYTTTHVSTITNTVTARPAVTTVYKRKHRKRRNCRPEPSSTLTLSSEDPETETASTTSTSVLEPAVPIASNCANLEEYSSACSCITAVETAQTVTAPASTSTSTIYETISEAIPSVSESTVSVVVTTVIVKPATTTAVTTVQTALQSATTVVTTVQAIQTAQLVWDSPGKPDRKLSVGVTGHATWANTGATTISLFSEPGRPYLTASPSLTLWITEYGGSYKFGPLRFLTAAYASSGSWKPVTCSVNPAGYVNCQASKDSSTSYTAFYECTDTGSMTVYLGTSDWVETGCAKVNVKLVAPPS